MHLPCSASAWTTTHAVILLTCMDTYGLNTFLCSVLGKIKAPERGLHFLQRKKMHRYKINYRKNIHNNMLPAIYLSTPGMPGHMVIDTGVELARKGFCRNWVWRQVCKAVMDLSVWQVWQTQLPSWALEWTQNIASPWLLRDRLSGHGGENSRSTSPRPVNSHERGRAYSLQ